jgi:protein-disulfide isomerase
MNKGTAIVGFFLCFLSGMGLMYGIDRSKGVGIEAEASEGGADHSAAAIPVTAKDPTWGDADAPVTIVEFSEFQCPFCARVLPTVKQIKDTYGPKKVRIVWKNQPLSFHQNAKPAAEAAQTVFALKGSEAFWKFHDLAFENQRTLTEENYEKWAAQAGVDVAKFKADYKAKKHAAKVDEDQALANKVGASGTPAFRINGVTLSGAQPFEKFKEVIDAQLAEANKLIAAGTPKNQVYPQAVKKNFEAPPSQPNQPDKPAQQPEEDKTIWKVPVAADDPVRGPKDALVTIVEWSDFQCPFCKRVEDTLNKVVETYPNDVRLVWKDNPLPFHPRAKPAAALARVAYKQKGDKGFWDAHKTLFAEGGKFEDAELQTVSTKLGLPWDQVKQAIDGNKFDDKFTQSMDLAMDLNARGTPHFFVNGFRVTGAQPFEKFKTVIDEQLAKAKAVVARGVPKAKVYDEIMKDAKGPPEPEKKEVPPPDAQSPFKGPANAKVVIQEFSDFECPFCKRVGPTLEQIEKEYGGKVKVVWRHSPLPFHKDAPLASEASQEAFAQKGNKGFWDYHDKLFAGQGTPDALKRPTLEKYAQELGLDMEKFKQALDTHKHKAKIDADMEIATKAGISGTPAFTIGKYFLSGAQPYPAFKKLIAKAMKE